MMTVFRNIYYYITGAFVIIWLNHPHFIQDIIMFILSSYGGIAYCLNCVTRASTSSSERTVYVRSTRFPCASRLYD